MPDNKKIILYGHAGSYNHGAEAITSCTIKLIRKTVPHCRILLSTHFAGQDREFHIDADEYLIRNMNGTTNEEVYLQTINQIEKDSICVHVGGDNYCYKNWQRYAAIHKRAVQKGADSVLWGCSIEADMLDDEMLRVLETHSLITAREEITYRTLKQHGLKNVVKVTDIAFLLNPVPVDFYMDNYVVVNLSPIVVHRNSVIVRAINQLIEYILKESSMNVVLLPHCLVEASNDCDALLQLDVHNSKRVLLVSDNLSAGQYKSIISKAQCGVFARTHAAIAAYSSGIPVLALGYSIKSVGIANDLGMSDYVVDTETIRSPGELLPYFIRMLQNEKKIRQLLAQRLPEYIKNTVSKDFLDILRKGE